VTAPLHISPAILEFQEQQTGERRISLLELEISAKDREISDKDRRIKALENLLAKFAARIDELEGRNSLDVRKIHYFEWREGWADREDRDSFYDEDQERRIALGITESDEAEYSKRKKLLHEKYPF
jgi:predicted RNase H-like nuclease (RuvC/YqgF family)